MSDSLSAGYVISFFTKIWPFVRAHKIALSVGGGVVAVGSVVGFVKRKQALAIGEQMVAKLKEKLGTPYIWGARSAEAMDCGGAVVWVLRELGLEPKKYNNTAAGLWKASSRVLFPQPGDLAFYGSMFGDPTHVMMVMEDGKVIGASGGGPSTTSVAKAEEQNAKVKILPANYRSDLRSYGRLPVQATSDTAVGGLDMLGSS